MRATGKERERERERGGWWVVKLKIQWKLVYCALYCNWMRKTLCAAVVIYFISLIIYFYTWHCIDWITHVPCGDRAEPSILDKNHTRIRDRMKKKDNHLPVSSHNYLYWWIYNGNFYSSWLFFFNIDLRVVNDNEWYAHWNLTKNRWMKTKQKETKKR